jgi:hypothetical protein
VVRTSVDASVNISLQNYTFIVEEVVVVAG